MTKEDFLAEFADQFDDTDASEINIDTKFHDLAEWSSLTAMSVIAMFETRYNKTITGADIRQAVTVEDLYNIANS